VAQRCIFCGRSPTTSTHVFRKAWLDRIFPSGQPFRHRHERKGKKAFDRHYAKRHFDVAPNSTCAKCNSGWMENIDIAAEPLVESCILERTTRTFDAAQQGIIARWITLAAFLLEQTTDDPVTPPEVLAEFRTAQTLPEGTQIWLAATGPGADGWELNAWPRPVKLDSPSFAGDGYICTFLIQHLVAQAFITPWTDRRIALNRPDDDFVRRIWPVAEIVTWPPPKDVPAYDLQVFAEAFIDEGLP